MSLGYYARPNLLGNSSSWPCYLMTKSSKTDKVANSWKHFTRHAVKKLDWYVLPFDCVGSAIRSKHRLFVSPFNNAAVNVMVAGRSDDSRTGTSVLKHSSAALW